METQKTSGLNETNDAVEAANKATWEDLNPDWLGDGDLTKRFAKSQFDTCPGCGKFEQLKVYNTSGDDQSASVLCLPCQWQVNGETPSEAIENWNRRCAGLRHTGEWVPVSEGLPTEDGWYNCTINDNDGWPNLTEPYWWDGEHWSDGNTFEPATDKTFIAYQRISTAPYNPKEDESE